MRENKNRTVTIGEICGWYFGLSSVKRLKTYKDLIWKTNNIRRILADDRVVDDLSIELIEAYQAKRGQEVSPLKKNNLIQPATIDKEVTALKTILNTAVRYGKIESNPIAKTPLLRIDNARNVILSEEDFESLLECAVDYLKPVLIKAFYEPMRKMEILKLTWDEVDLTTTPGFIRLTATRTKTNKARSIPLHPRVRQTLAKLSSGFRGGRVFLLPNGKPFDGCKKSFRSALKLAGIEDFVFHDFRHCAITNMRRAGNDYATIMKAAGLKTMSVFFRYNLVDEEDLKQMKWNVESEEGKRKKNKLKNRTVHLWVH